MQEIEIKSRPGTFVKLDDDVADKIGHWGWCQFPTGYIYAHIPKSGKSHKRTYLARAVIWAVTGQWPEKGMEVDHINHNKLDNQIANLRVVTPSQNQRNRTLCDKYKNRFKGIKFDPRRGTWYGRVGLKIDKKTVNVSGSATPDEAIAAMARDCLCDLIGGFLLPNFPHMTFKDKWEYIGEPQRNQILHSLTKNGFKAAGG